MAVESEAGRTGSEPVCAVTEAAIGRRKKNAAIDRPISRRKFFKLILLLDFFTDFLIHP